MCALSSRSIRDWTKYLSFSVLQFSLSELLELLSTVEHRFMKNPILLASLIFFKFYVFKYQRLVSITFTVQYVQPLLLYIYIILIIILDFRSVLVWQLTCKQTWRPLFSYWRWSAATLKQVTDEGNKVIVSAKSDLGSWRYFDQPTSASQDTNHWIQFNFIPIAPNHNTSRLGCFMNLICSFWRQRSERVWEAQSSWA